MSPSRGAGRAAAALCWLSLLCTAGFVAAYIQTDSPQLEGLLLGTSLAALGLALAVSSARLLPSETCVEERPPLSATPPKSRERLAAAGERAAAPGIPRRALGLSVLGLGAAAVVPLRSLLPGSRGPLTLLTRTGWAGGARVMTRDRKRVRPDDLAVGSTLTVFPEAGGLQDDATAVLVRLPAGELEQSPAGTAGSVEGIVAFSKLCTHAGCPVGLYEEQSRQLLCPCHQSVFDVRDGARPLAGPAARALPRLPLGVDADGYLMAVADFQGQVGPTWWRRG